MPYIRLGAFAVFALTFMLAACSTDNDLAAVPRLEPQYGTANEDIGLGVATASTGRIYELWEETAEYYDDWGSGLFRSVYLRRYDNNGTLVFNRQVENAQCSYEEVDYGHCDVPRTSGFTTNAQGKVYALYSYTYVGSDCTNNQYSFVDVYDSAGYRLNRIDVGSTGNSLNGDYNAHVAMAVDGSGNFYVVAEQAEVDYSYCEPHDVLQTISKRSPTGSLLWQRTSTVGIPYSITVTTTGNVYVMGSKGMARYSSTGNLMWTKTGTNYAVGQYSKIVASGTNLYTRNVNTIRKYDANGKLLWSKVQSGLNTLVIGDISADGTGNVYISGKYRPTTSSPANAFVRKLRPTGAILWTKTFGTPQYDDARGIATINGSEIYVTGETQGSLAHTNIGGKDGYLRKLNSLGNPVWTR